MAPQCPDCLESRKTYDLDAEGVCVYCQRLARQAEPPPPALATHHSPGSPEKVEVLRERAEGGYGLWHPGDVGEGTGASRQLRDGPCPARAVRVRRVAG